MAREVAFIPDPGASGTPAPVVGGPRGPAWTQEQIAELNAARDLAVARAGEALESKDIASEKRDEAVAAAVTAGEKANQAGASEEIATAAAIAAGESEAVAGQAAIDAGAALTTAQSLVTALGDAAGGVPYGTWAALQAHGLTNGQRATVISADVGTHTDPATSEVVLNAGVYEKQVAYADPVRIANLESLDAAAAAASAQASATSINSATRVLKTTGRPAVATLVTGTPNASANMLIWREPVDFDSDVEGIDFFKTDAGGARAAYMKLLYFDGTNFTMVNALTQQMLSAGAGIKTILPLIDFAKPLKGYYLGIYIGATTVARTTITDGSAPDSGGFWLFNGNTTSYALADAISTVTNVNFEIRIRRRAQVVTGAGFVTAQTDIASNATRIAAAETKVSRLSADTRVRQLSAQVAALRSGAPVAYTPNVKALALAAACVAAGAPMSAARINRASHMYDLLDAAGVTTDVLPAAYVSNYLVGDTSGQKLARLRINLMQPGTYDLIVNGSPSISDTGGVTFPTNADYFDTGLPLSALDYTKASLGEIANARGEAVNTSTSAYDAGVQYDGTRRLAINATTTGVAGNYAAMGTAVARNSAQSPYLDGRNVISVRRLSSGQIALCKMGRPVGGIAIGGVSSAAVAPTSAIEAAKTIYWGKMNTGTAGTRSANTGYALLVDNGMNDDQAVRTSAAFYDFLNSVWWGDTMIYDVGVGPKTIRADVIVHGLTPAAMACAYTVRRAGIEVAMLGAWNDYNAWDLGMSVPLYTDAKRPDKTGGLHAQGCKWMMQNIHGISSPGLNQFHLSPEPRAWRAYSAHLTDPTRTDAKLPGQDIPVYMNGGIRKASKIDNQAIAIHTNDGRSAYGKMFVQGDYEGDLLEFLDLPRITGHEAAFGSLIEANAGFTTVAKRPRSGAASGGVELFISTYRVDGDAESGQLPDIENLPSLTQGSACFALQSMNFRQVVVNDDKTRWAPLSETPTDAYATDRYETFARQQAADTATAPSLPMVKSDILAIGPLVASNSRFQDMNNQGTGATSLDLGNSGTQYAAAGTDLVARRGIIEDLRNRQYDWWYFIRKSGDPRIQPGIVSALQPYHLDCLQYLDPGPFGELHQPSKAYVREPTYMAKNAGFVMTADDIAVEGQVNPRLQRPISFIDYSFDRHAMYVASAGGYLASYGGYGLAHGGADLMSPFPFEAAVPDKSECLNVVLLTAWSVTKTLNSAARMEPMMIRAGQMMGYAIIVAIRKNIAVQDVPYEDILALEAASGYDIPLYLPTVN